MIWNIIDGDFYVHSQLGDDTNAGDSANPFKTLQKALTTAGAGSKIVARGYFNEITIGGGEFVFGDGYFELDGIGLSGGIYAVHNYNIENCIIRNWTYAFYGGLYSENNCVIIDCTYSHRAPNQSDTNAVFINVSIAGIQAGTGIWNKCVFINNVFITFKSLAIIKNCIFVNGSGNIICPTPTSMDYNCFEQGVTINGETLAQRQASYPLLDINSIQPVSAGLNDVADKDFTLSVDPASIVGTSVCIGAGEGGVDIGYGFKSFSMDGVHALFDGVSGNGSKDVNVSINAGGHISLNSGTIGKITSDVIDLVDKGLEFPVGKILLFGDENIGLSDGFDFSDMENLTYEMRWGDSSVNCLAASFEPFHRRSIPTIDSLGRGNANAAFDNSTSGSITDGFIQIRITFRGV